MHVLGTSRQVIKEEDKQKLADKNGGHTQPKGQMLRFMTKYAHAQNRADASAQSCGQKQSLFWNPPFVLDGFMLVDAHKQKTDEIQNNKINAKNEY